MNTLQKIGLVTKNMRVARGLSQEQFCLQCGIDQHYISNVENGQRNISVDVVERIATFFGLSLSQFFAAVEAAQICQPTAFVSEEVPTRKKSTEYHMTKINHEGFVDWMKRQGLSERTIGKYSSDTVNCTDVQKIIKIVTGSTQNMYSVINKEQLLKIIERIRSSEFDQTGHCMYSAGVKKWMAYLTAIGEQK